MRGFAAQYRVIGRGGAEPTSFWGPLEPVRPRRVLWILEPVRPRQWGLWILKPIHPGQWGLWILIWVLWCSMHVCLCNCVHLEQQPQALVASSGQWRHQHAWSQSPCGPVCVQQVQPRAATPRPRCHPVMAAGPCPLSPVPPQMLPSPASRVFPACVLCQCSLQFPLSGLCCVAGAPLNIMQSSGGLGIRVCPQLVC